MVVIVVVVVVMVVVVVVVVNLVGHGFCTGWQSSNSWLPTSNKKVMAELARMGDAEASLLFCFDRQVR